MIKKAIQQAIQLAIEAGWISPICDCEATEENPEAVCINMGTQLPCCPEEVIFLDPLFWQSLGKALGWKKAKVGTRAIEDWIGTYLYYWHRFIDHLAEGKDPDEFFKELLK